MTDRRGAAHAGGTPATGWVAVDARALHASGIGRYLRELLAHWLVEAPFAGLTLLGDPDALAAFVAARPGAMPVRVMPHAGRMYGAAAQWSWWRVRHDVRADVTFFPHWDAPVVGFPRRGVVTVHDLTHFRAPGAFGRWRSAAAWPVVRRVARAAARVVCVSHAAAADVAAALPATAAKLRVVPNGVSARFFGPPPGAGAGVPAPGPSLLWVGNLKPHKNPGVALDVLARARAAGHASLRLVVVGGASRGVDVAALAHARGVAAAVDVVGVVDDDRLHALYAGCVALLFPSRHEGFGLPVVEAMAAGAPVVGSDIPAVAEVAGGAAALFAPDDVDGMAGAVSALLADPTRRAAQVAAGRARAANFSWAAAAHATAAVLAEAGGFALRGPGAGGAY